MKYERITHAVDVCTQRTARAARYFVGEIRGACEWEKKNRTSALDVIDIGYYTLYTHEYVDIYRTSAGAVMVYAQRAPLTRDVARCMVPLNPALAA